MPDVPHGAALLFSVVNVPIMYGAIMDPTLLDVVRPSTRQASMPCTCACSCPVYGGVCAGLLPLDAEHVRAR